MPIITPAYPSMCATYNITRSSMAIIQEELERGSEIAEKIMAGKTSWTELFEKHSFFTAGYKYYLAVIAASNTKEAHQVWSGFVESKVRVLVQGLERHQSIALAHAFVKGYERKHECHSEAAIEEVREGSLNYLVNKSRETEKTLNKSTGVNDRIVVTSEDNKATAGDLELAAGEVGTNGAENNEVTGPTKTEVFTTTFYIGLNLNEGVFFSPNYRWQ